MRIRREEPRDVPAIRTINLTAFGSASEADIVDALRSDARHVISLVAEEDDALIGHILFSPVDVAGADLRAMALAPMAVIPDRQRTGVGSALVRAGLDECRRSGAAAVFVLGHPSYYPRFGFATASTLGFRCEFDAPDDAFMVSELVPGALSRQSGLVCFDKAFRNA